MWGNIVLEDDFVSKNKIIFAILIAVIAILMVGAASAFSLFGKTQTKLNITGEDTLYPGDNLTINLTNDKGEAIENATVNITVTGDNGFNKTANVTTNKSGIAVLEIDYEAGTYAVNCSYAGDDDFEASDISKNITVKANEVATSDDSSSSGDPGAFYSAQEGRIIYTGEVHDAPDGHKYKHLGNNEWQKID